MRVESLREGDKKNINKLFMEEADRRVKSLMRVLVKLVSDE